MNKRIEEDYGQGGSIWFLYFLVVSIFLLLHFPQHFFPHFLFGHKINQIKSYLLFGRLEYVLRIKKPHSVYCGSEDLSPNTLKTALANDNERITSHLQSLSRTLDKLIFFFFSSTIYFF